MRPEVRKVRGTRQVAAAGPPRAQTAPMGSRSRGMHGAAVLPLLATLLASAAALGTGGTLKVDGLGLESMQEQQRGRQQLHRMLRGSSSSQPGDPQGLNSPHEVGRTAHARRLMQEEPSEGGAEYADYEDRRTENTEEEPDVYGMARPLLMLTLPTAWL